MPAVSRTGIHPRSNGTQRADTQHRLAYHAPHPFPDLKPPIVHVMKFCSHCGTGVVVRVPPGDDKPRHVCDNCGTIHYKNPLMVIGSIPEWEGRILLCKRAIEPRLGYWTLPAGFMELGETTSAAAVRETLEEANARIELGDLYTMLSVPHANQVHIFYRARLLDLDFGPGAESLEVALFAEDEIPWEDIAFRTISTTLRHFFADRREGQFQTRSGDIPVPLRSP
jgi:ADP-ribose pyrophosphatase YjhB (NUDIX family)